MSHTTFEPVTERLHRSELAAPGSNPKMIEKASRSAADVIFLDLEDSVAPDDKPQARKNVIAALNDLDWGRKTVSVRINGLDTPYTYRDVIEVAEACPRLDMLFLPKAGVAADVYALDVLVTQIERTHKREKRIGFEVMIETALGLCNVKAIAQSSRRLERTNDEAVSRPVSVGPENVEKNAVLAVGEGGQGGVRDTGVTDRHATYHPTQSSGHNDHLCPNHQLVTPRQTNRPASDAAIF